MEQTTTNTAFFGPIMKITAVTMIGTFGVAWGIHTLALQREQARNEAAIGAVQFRIDQINAYAVTYKSEGSKKAISTLK